MQFTADTVRTATGGKSVVVLTTYGPVSQLGARRLPWYHRFDARFTRDVITSRGRVSFFADVFNVLNSVNLAAWNYHPYVSGTTVVVRRSADTLIGMLPSAGLTWEF